MNVRVTDKIKIDAEHLAISSAAGATSLNYDMQNYHRAAAVVNISADGSANSFSTATIDLMESSGSTVAGTSAAGGSAGIVVGGAGTLVQSSVSGVRKMTLTFGTAASTGMQFTINLGTVSKTFEYTQATANFNATAQSATLSYYGATAASSANTGSQLAMGLLSSNVNSTLAFGGDLICSTRTTASLTLQVADSADGRSLGFQDSTGAMTASIHQAVGGFNIGADELTSTLNKRYVGVKVSSAATACGADVSIVRTGGRYNPPTFSGRLGT